MENEDVETRGIPVPPKFGTLPKQGRDPFEKVIEWRRPASVVSDWLSDEWSGPVPVVDWGERAPSFPTRQPVSWVEVMADAYARPQPPRARAGRTALVVVALIAAAMVATLV